MSFYFTRVSKQWVSDNAIEVLLLFDAYEGIVEDFKLIDDLCNSNENFKIGLCECILGHLIMKDEDDYCLLEDGYEALKVYKETK